LITSKVLPGSPRSAILEEAERWKADLIVVGSHGYGAWQRLVLGSVSQAVVLHAKCSVEVVRRCDEGQEVKAA
jgi:nucleotide-binding universal stress UspA family protein